MIAKADDLFDLWRIRRQMYPPDDLMWTHVLGVLVGQADGEVFIPQSAVAAIGRFDLEIEGDLLRDGWYVRLRPLESGSDA